MKFDFLSLSNQELIVCAGFLGDRILYGVDSKLFNDWDVSASEQIEQNVRLLEEKGLLSIQPDGIVRMNDLLLQCLECMLNSDEILFSEYSDDKVKKERTFYYKKDNRICCLEKKPNGRNKVYFWKSKLEMPTKLYVLEECISKEVIMRVKRLQDSFEDEEALGLLKSCLKKPEDVELVRKVVNRKHCGGRLHYWKWQQNRICTRRCVNYGVMDEGVFEFEIDSQGNYIFTGNNKNYQEVLKLFFGGENECDNCNSN